MVPKVLQYEKATTGIGFVSEPREVGFRYGSDIRSSFRRPPRDQWRRGGLEQREYQDYKLSVVSYRNVEDFLTLIGNWHWDTSKNTLVITLLVPPNLEFAILSSHAKQV